MANVFDDIPVYEFKGRKEIAPPVQAGAVSQVKQPESNFTTRLLDGVSQTFFPEKLNEAFNEKNPIKAGGKFILGLAESAWLLPKSLFESSRNFVSDITNAALGTQKAREGRLHVDGPIQQGLKESGLAGGFLSGLSTTLPILASVGGVLKLRPGATVAETTEAVLTGTAPKQGPLPVQKPKHEPLRVEPTHMVSKKGQVNVVTVKEIPKSISGYNLLDTTPVTILDNKITQIKTALSTATDKTRKLKLKESLTKAQQYRMKLVNHVKAVSQDIQTNGFSPKKAKVANTLPDELKVKLTENSLPPQKPGIGSNFLDVETRLAAQGPAGRTMVQLIRDSLEQPVLDAADFTTNASKTMDGMTRNELFNLKGVLQGKAAPINERVSQAADALKMQDEAIASLAEQHVPKFARMKNHYTQTLPTEDVLKNKSYVADLVDNMVNLDKTVATEQMAHNLINDWRLFLKDGTIGQHLADYVKRTKQIDIADGAGFQSELRARLSAYTRPSLKFGPFEARSLDLPFYDPNPARALPKYYEGAFEYLHKLQHWGPNGQKLYDLAQIIEQQGGDVNFATNVADFLVKGESADLAFSSMRDAIMKANSVQLLDFAFIPNLFQGFTGPAVMGGLKNSMKAVKQLTDTEARLFAQRTGGLSQQRATNSLRGIYGTDLSTGLASKVLAPFKWTELNNFYEAAITGRFFMNEMADRLKLNAADDFATRQLTNIGFSPTEIASISAQGLDDRMLRLGGLRFWKRSQSIPDVLSLPLFAQSGWGKLFAQFRTVAYKQTGAMWTQVVGELKKGNPYPLIITATVFPAVGEVIGDLKDLLKGKNPFGEDSKSLLVNPSVSNYFDRLGQSFAFGILNDLFYAASKRTGIAEFTGGPTASRASEGLYGVWQAASGKPKQLIKFINSMVPFAGDIMNNVFFPPKSK